MNVECFPLAFQTMTPDVSACLALYILMLSPFSHMVHCVGASMCVNGTLILSLSLTHAHTFPTTLTFAHSRVNKLQQLELSSTSKYVKAFGKRVVNAEWLIKVSLTQLS